MTTPHAPTQGATAVALSAGPDIHAAEPGSAWWRHAVVYQVYPRSWADSDGDGVGDLPGIAARLDHLVELGVDALWLSPFYVSPHNDAGYDVADYREVDPLFGTLVDADALLARARELGLRVIVDLVPNHTSSEHPWFRAALAAEPGGPERARYLFRPGSGPTGDAPPNDWRSVFGGPAWTQVSEGDAVTGRRGQWYLHLFDVTQPDLDWTNPQVREEFEAILRFWLDRGVDGFRVDVAHGLVKAEGLPQWREHLGMLAPGAGERPEDPRPPMWDQEGVHDIYRAWRRVLDEANPSGPAGTARHDPDLDRILVAEAWVQPIERAVRYARPDEMHQAFNFAYLQAPWTAPAQRGVIEESLRSGDAVGAPTTWVLSNHDVIRHASRLGLPTAREAGRGPNGLGPADPQPDAELGLRRARAATAMMLALPGSGYLYQGEELGLPEHTTLPEEALQDPTWVRSGHAHRGRDGCRIPMPWEADAPAAGFSASGRTWLPQPPSYAALAVDRQRGVAGSTYELYRTLLRCRRDLQLGRGSLAFMTGYADDVVAFRVTGTAGDNERPAQVVVVANLGTAPVPLPPGRVLACSGELVDGLLPVDTAVWIAP